MSDVIIVERVKVSEESQCHVDDLEWGHVYASLPKCLEGKFFTKTPKEICSKISELINGDNFLGVGFFGCSICAEDLNGASLSFMMSIIDGEVSKVLWDKSFILHVHKIVCGERIDLGLAHDLVAFSFESRGALLRVFEPTF